MIDSPMLDLCPWPTDVRNMQLAHLEGWELVFADDFDTNMPAGAFPGAYGHRWHSYDGFADTSGLGYYDQSIISVHDSVLDLHLRTENGRPLGAAPVPLVGGQWGGQVYGRFSVRLRADPVAGFGMASLLWSDREIWAEGEVNFPEGDLDGTTSAFVHCLGAPEITCFEADTNVSFAQWHTYTTEWTPGSLKFYLDGELIGATTENVPIESMHWVIQAGTVDSVPDPAAEGHIMIDWATIHTYTPRGDGAGLG
jgi:beta-glucanase (GH16 family)